MRIQHWESNSYSGAAKKVETRHPPLTKNTTSQDNAVYADWLGDHAFTKTHGSRFAYLVGEMARGIATPRIVIAAV